NAFLYSGTCTWVAYWSLYPPAKMTTSSGALGSTPSGFSLLTLPVEPEVLPPPPLLVAQASSRAAPGIATRLAAAALRRRVRRLVPVSTPRGLFGFSGEEGILRSSLVRVVRKPESGVRVHEVIGHVRPAWGRVRRAGGGDPHGPARAAQWTATARAVAWNAAWARSCVRCATAMYSRSRTTSWGWRPDRASGRNVVACIACSSTMSATSASGERGKLVNAMVVAPLLPASASISMVSRVWPECDTPSATSPGRSRAALASPLCTSVQDQAASPIRCRHSCISAPTRALPLIP